MTILKVTRRYEGRPTALRPEVHNFENGGGWKSVQEMKRTRLPELKRVKRLSKVEEIEFGVRTEEPLTGACKGITRVEVIEFLENLVVSEAA